MTNPPDKPGYFAVDFYNSDEATKNLAQFVTLAESLGYKVVEQTATSVLMVSDYKGN